MNIESRRLMSLDGLRGVAALIVVCFHFASAFLPDLVPNQTATPYRIADTPIGILLNGPFSVSVFFVLSGFVVSNAAAKRRSPIYVNLPLRYLRLAVPVLCSVFYGWALLKVIPTATTELNRILPHPWLQRTYQGDIPGLFRAVANGSLGVFVQGESKFNNVLWTMKIELLGSFALYVIYGLLFGRDRIAVIAALGVMSFVHIINTAYLGFVFGAIMRDLWAAGNKPVYPFALFLAGILLGFPAHGFLERVGFQRVPTIFALGENESAFASIAAALIVHGVLYSRMGELFSSPPCQFLGKISFPLYLIHVPLLYTAFAALYVAIAPVSSTEIFAIFALFLVASLCISWLAEKAVDAPTLEAIAFIRTKFPIPQSPTHA